MIININADNPSDGKLELLVGRLAVTNSVVDPWIYIVLRKENFEAVEKFYRKYRCGVCTSDAQRSTSNPNLGNQQSVQTQATASMSAV